MNHADGIPAPVIEYHLVLPMLIIIGAAVAGVLIEALAPRGRRYSAQVSVTLAALVGALAAVLFLAGTRAVAVMGSLAIDGPVLFVQALILLIGVLAVGLIAENRCAAFIPQASVVPGSAAERVAAETGAVQTAVFPLTLFSVGGLLLLPAANDMLTMFVALEVFALPLYLMCGLACRRRLLSQEAALKYFLLGAFSSAFFVFGVALLYGYSGTLTLPGIRSAIDTSGGDTTLALLGAGLVSVGVLFKIGAVPFHSWVPDVYQGAPVPVTAFMAAATKVAAFGALFRIGYVALPGLHGEIRPVLSVIAALTMTVGAVLAVSQRDVRRMLAYTAIAQSGFLLLGPIAGTQSALGSTMFYLTGYGFCAVGAFAVVGIIEAADTPLSDGWSGLAYRSPVLAIGFTVILLALAGIPLTSGFAGKFALFGAAAAAGSMPLVVIGVVASAITAFVYARVILVMFFIEPAPDSTAFPTVGSASSATVMLTAAVAVAVGVAPQPLLTLTGQLGQFAN